MKRLPFKDIKTFLATVERALWTQKLFRGQTCSRPLLPKIARADPTKDTTKTEKEMLSELRRRGTLFLERNADAWELLVYAQHFGTQHFGMATRLLDWTSNPLTALWFACQPGSKAGYLYQLSVDDDLLLDRTAQPDPFKIRRTRVFKPSLNNGRVIAQCGWFTAHRRSTTAGRFVPLDHNSEVTKSLVQFEVPAAAKEDILKTLDVLGINSQSLFPDIEGVCKHLNWLHGL